MRIPIFAFPWTCWKCKREMNVTYPFCKAAYESDFRGNLGETYGKTLQSEVIGNLCPLCKAYQGNWFVEDDGLSARAKRDMKNGRSYQRY